MTKKKSTNRYSEVTTPEYAPTLEELVAQITEENRHEKSIGVPAVG
jgi:hypothetical protein